MVSWSTQMRSLSGIASATAIALVLSSGNAMAEDVPGDLWVVNYVKVNGANQDAVRSGLKKAADTYFYGFDTETHMEADVQDNGTYDVRVIGPGGKVLARQNGLSYDTTGDISRSVAASAKSWMGNLGCAEGCAVAVNGAAPAPAKPIEVAAKPVEVAEVAEQAVERVEAAAPKPDAAVEVTEIVKPVEPATSVTVAETPTIAKPAVSVPTAPSVTEDVKVAAKPAEAKKPEGLDADLVLARPNVATAPPAGVSGAAKPAAPKPAASPKVPQAQTLAKPNVAASPSAGTGSTTPSIAVAEPQKPVVAEKPEVASAPEVKVVQPSVAATETPAVTTTTEARQPTIAEVTSPAPEAPKEAEVAPTVTAIVTEQPKELEITPGVTLPAPDADAAPATVAEIAEQAKPADNVEEVATPSVPTIVTPTVAPSAVATVTESEQPSTPSDDGDGEQLALVNPQREVTPLPTAPVVDSEALAPKPEDIETSPTETTAPESEPVETPAAVEPPKETETDTTVETRIAAVDPTAEGPTLANARWVGFTPAVFTGSDNKAGAWISGPFDRKQRTGWITDTATGATTRVTFIWREGGSGSRTALLSREAAKALGLGQGDVANVAVYLPR